MTDLGKILPIVLVALVIISAVQAFQLNSLKEKLDSGAISTGSKGPVAAGSAGSAVASSGSTAGGAAPSSISDLPSMVGGC